jgi:hypothetical protein
MDCTDYNSKSCPKGNTIINKLTTDKIKTFMVGCWGVYCWDGEIEITSYEPPPKNSNPVYEELLKKKTEIFGQKSVVDAIKQYSYNLNIDSIFLAGDNVYSYNVPKEKLIEIIESKNNLPTKKQYKNDPTISSQYIEKQLSQGFLDCFSNSNIKNFYIALGNHDVQNCHDLNTQLNYNLTHKNELDEKKLNYTIPSTYYNVIYNLKDYSINFIVIDTNMYSEDTTCNPNIKYSEQNKLDQQNWVINTLKTNKTTWNIIIGHIPYIAKGHKKKNPNIFNKDIDDLFKSIEESKCPIVQVYMCADEHNQQFLQYNNINLVVAGSGGTALDKLYDKSSVKTIYEKSTFGFTSFSFHKEKLSITYIQTNPFLSPSISYKVQIDTTGQIVKDKHF